MTRNEAALQLTRTAMEQGYIKIDNTAPEGRAATEEQNSFNAKQVSDFFKKVVGQLPNK